MLPTRAIFHGAMTTTCCHNAWQAPWIRCNFLKGMKIVSLTNFLYTIY